MITPDKKTFCAAYEKGEAQVVYASAAADLQTPVGIYMKLTAQDDTHTFLLESVEDGEVRGRYSIIGLHPDLLFRVVNGRAEINDTPPTKPDNFVACDDPPLIALRQILAQSRLALPEGLAPTSAGVFGYMGYDMVRFMETLPDNNPDTLNVPDCFFMRPTLVMVHDNVGDTINAVVPVRPDATPAKIAYENACEKIEDALNTLTNADSTSIPSAPLAIPHDFTEPTSNISQQDYFKMVEAAKSYIEAGDVFQVVLSQRFETDFTLPPLALYRSLRRVNPSPYLFLFKFAEFALVGSSPEVMVGVNNRVINIRPVAGTRKRGADNAEDEAIGVELLADEKERAEHLMLLDLGRNDVGRVSQIGSIKVNTQFALQKTSHLIHIVSDVTGKLRPECDVVDALVAGFPAGTVSGAPKIRAMEIIDELEPVRRGAYAGCVGYFCANGDMVSSITLRTALLKDGKAYVQAGGGIVYDSTPQYEYDETVNKAAALFKAIKIALEEAAKRKNR